MGHDKVKLSEKEKAVVKSLSGLLDILEDINTNDDGSDSYSFTDEDGNTVHLETDAAVNRGIITLDFKQNNVDITIAISKPLEQMTKDIENGGLSNVLIKKK